jgi:hypothetical protein
MAATNFNLPVFFVSHPDSGCFLKIKLNRILETSEADEPILLRHDTAPLSSLLLMFWRQDFTLPVPEIDCQVIQCHIQEQDLQSTLLWKHEKLKNKD